MPGLLVIYFNYSPISFKPMELEKCYSWWRIFHYLIYILGIFPLCAISKVYSKPGKHDMNTFQEKIPRNLINLNHSQSVTANNTTDTI